MKDGLCLVTVVRAALEDGGRPASVWSLWSGQLQRLEDMTSLVVRSVLLVSMFVPWALLSLGPRLFLPAGRPCPSRRSLRSL